MSIKFSCPHCKKDYLVKDHLAGKRVPCIVCKKPLTIPAPISQPADIEELAAAALSEQPAAQAAQAAKPAAATSMIEFNCYYCDTKIQVGSDLGGKQYPCPECSRIIKVPLPQKVDPTDWRQVETRLPAGARRDTGPAPEGTWGTANVTAVSREALVEAEAFPDVREPWTWRQWTKLGTAAAVLLGVAGLGTWLALHYLNQNRQTGAYARVVQYLDAPDKSRPEDTGALHRWVGEYELRAHQPEKAKNHFQKARESLSGAKDLGPTLQDLMLIDVALSQLDLGGEKPEVKEGTRLKWEDAQKEAAQTLQALHTPEGRAMGIRAVSRKLIDKGLGARVAPMASRFPDAEVAELLAVVGLEMLHGKPDAAMQKKAEELAGQAQQRLAKPHDKPAAGKAGGPVPPPALLALWLALGKQDKVPALPSGPAGTQGELALPVVMGWVEGLARRGDLAEARNVLRKYASQAVRRLPCLLVLVAAGCEREEAQLVRPDLEEALGLAADPNVARTMTPWHWLRLARLGQLVGLETKRVQALATEIPDGGLRAWVQLEDVRQQLAGSKELVEDALAQPLGKETFAYKLALEAIARQNTRYGGSGAVLKAVESWEPEPLRPFGYAGIALGLQDLNP